MMSLPRRSLPVLAASLFFTAEGAHARECEGVSFPDALSVDQKKLLLNGIGVREATVFNVNVYVAALYLETRSKDGAQIAASEQLKRIQLVFVRDVSRADMTEAIEGGFKKAAGAEFAKLSARVEKLKSLLPEFKKTEALTLTYRPGKGLDLTAPGRKGAIEGADFARTLFLIWLGAHPPNEGLKRGLLGGGCG
jgi:hypothetical protein